MGRASNVTMRWPAIERTNGDLKPREKGVTLATIRRRTCGNGHSYSTGAPVEIALVCPRCGAPLLDENYRGVPARLWDTEIESGDEDGICANAAAIIKADYTRAVRFVEIWKESD